MKKEAWIIAAIVVGFIVGVYYCIAVTCMTVGLSPIGPVAGGAFARYQGAGVPGGSVMARAQSFAMGGMCCGPICCIALGLGAIYAIYAGVKCYNTD